MCAAASPSGSNSDPATQIPAGRSEVLRVRSDGLQDAHQRPGADADVYAYGSEELWAEPGANSDANSDTNSDGLSHSGRNSGCSTVAYAVLGTHADKLRRSCRTGCCRADADESVQLEPSRNDSDSAGNRGSRRKCAIPTADTEFAGWIPHGHRDHAECDAGSFGAACDKYADRTACSDFRARTRLSRKIVFLDLMSDYYEILGLPRDANGEEIRSAFRKLSLELHPDRTQNDPESTEDYKLVMEAYEILSNPEVRSAYDEALIGYGGGRPRANMKDILEGIGSMAGLFMEAVARAHPSKVEIGTCIVCKGKGELAIDLGVIHLSKRCEGCGGTGKITVETAHAGERQE